jgi:hypothetical protein
MVGGTATLGAAHYVAGVTHRGQFRVSTIAGTVGAYCTIPTGTVGQRAPAPRV